VYKRDRNDLFMEKKIKLVEALCGLQFVLTHLDSRNLLIQSREVIKPGDIKCVENEGMPIKGNPLDRGRLMIKFDIEFPESVEVTPDIAKILTSVLPKPTVASLPMDVEECVLSEPSGARGGGRRQREAYEDGGSDEEEGRGRGGGERVACHQQ